jgi:hypothetical protein
VTAAGSPGSGCASAARRVPGGPRAAAAALLAAVAAPGCSLLFPGTAVDRDVDAARAEASRPAPSPFGVDEPGVLHVHTRLSHDSPGPLDEVVDAARRTGARWVCLNDHTNPAVGRAQPRGRVGGVLVVPGEETSWSGGSVLALGAERSVVKRRQPFAELAAEVRALGGVPMYGHVTEIHGRPPRVMDGLAVYDLSADYREVGLMRFGPVLRATGSGDPGRSARAYLRFVQRRPVEALAQWDAWLADGPCAGVAETNAHGKFRWFGKTWDPYVSLLGLVRNHALVPTLDEASLLDALRRGRVAVGFDAAADASGARFEAWRGGAPAAAMGDAIPFEPALSLAIHLPGPARVRVLRDGKPWREGKGRVLSFPVEGTGVYRAEADLVLGGERRPWVIFNPIRVGTPSPSPGPSPRSP